MTTKSVQSTMTFSEQVRQRWQQGNFVCVGLDSEYKRLPDVVKRAGSIEEAIVNFNRAIIDATHDLVCSYKPNAAFYEAQGEAGQRALLRTIRHIKAQYPHIPVILDAKRADIGNTNTGYIEAAFDLLGADAITVHPYLGREALAPFLARKDKGIIVLVKTSNPGSGELQDLPVGERAEPLYQVVARYVAQQWNANGNCALVVGATYPTELQQVRALVGDLPFLIPGIGAQGGAVEATVKAARDSHGQGMIINSSRNIIFASPDADFAQAARTATLHLHEEINQALL